ncbi:sensor histidine kinase [Catellatospora coxensis]|uniref:histidine kinase n=1 Tax=Catellatospora coxensis TaxID=310354 RepID=A0A8J3KQD6_9ACTN|nr:histidine kinase [Catellatospora coxensis]GIG04333.1 two-component sensor histidine kinase [Catellatospora coxensis]
MGDLRPRMPGEVVEKPRLTWFDFVITAVALIVGQIDELVGAGSPGLLGRSAVAEVLTLAAGLSLLARRRWPRATTLFVAACHLLAFTPFVFAVMMYTMGVITRTWWQLGVLSVFGVGVQALSAAEGLDPDVRAWAYTLSFALGPLLLGYAAGVRQELVVSLRERAGDLERERDMMAQTARRAERARIAREMHDVVAHRVSNIVVTATALQSVPEAQVPPLRSEVDRIREEGRAALTELRALLGLLNARGAAGERAPLAPQATARDLPALVERMRGVGRMPVELDVTGFPELLPDQTQRAVYRVVQESLTNAVKHAPGAAVRVGVRCAADGVHVTVDNDGPPGGRDAGLPGSGRGLIGLSERVDLLGGEFAASPLPGGGFRVTAVIPPAGRPRAVPPAGVAARPRLTGGEGSS